MEKFLRCAFVTSLMFVVGWGQWMPRPPTSWNPSLPQYGIPKIPSARWMQQGLPEGVKPDLFMDWMDKRLKNFCPSGIDRCECVHEPGKITSGPFLKSEDFIGSLTNFVTCNPGFCYCKDAPDVEVDIRMQMIRVVMDLCPRGEIDRCLCKDDTKIHFPFTLMDIMNCEPKRCKCKKSDGVKTLTAMGCPKGGFAWGSDTAAECKDGTILNMPADAMRHYLKHGDNGCLCPDGIFPKLKSTGDFPKCPNGESADWSLGGPEDFVKCRQEPW